MIHPRFLPSRSVEAGDKVERKRSGRKYSEAVRESVKEIFCRMSLILSVWTADLRVSRGEEKQSLLDVTIGLEGC